MNLSLWYISVSVYVSLCVYVGMPALKGLIHVSHGTISLYDR